MAAVPGNSEGSRRMTAFWAQRGSPSMSRHARSSISSASLRAIRTTTCGCSITPTRSSRTMKAAWRGACVSTRGRRCVLKCRRHKAVLRSSSCRLTRASPTQVAPGDAGVAVIRNLLRQDDASVRADPTASRRRYRDPGDRARVGDQHRAAHRGKNVAVEAIRP